MGLAIDGNEVHGIAKGGQAFLSIGNTYVDGSINIGGQDYLNKNQMKIKSTDLFDASINDSTTTIDVTDRLSNYEGYLAICVIYAPNIDSSTAYTTHTVAPNVSKTFTISQLIIIPTAPATDNLSFSNENWSGSLSKTTDNKFTFVVDYGNDSTTLDATGTFYILSND